MVIYKEKKKKGKRRIHKLATFLFYLTIIYIYIYIYTKTVTHYTKQSGPQKSFILLYEKWMQNEFKEEAYNKQD